MTEDFPAVSLDEWRVQALAKAPEGTEPRTSIEDGLDIQWLYTSADALADDPGGAPAQAPFVRGVRVGEAWDIRQERTEPERPAAAAAAREDLEGGVTSVGLRIGLDRQGVAIYTVDDLDEALDGVYLDMAPLALDAGAHAREAAALAAALWERREHDAKTIKGAFRYDPLGTLALEGVIAGEPEEAVKQAGEFAKQTAERFADVTALAVDTRAYVEAGASAAQELALAICTGVAYLRACDDAGLGPAAAARRIELTVSVGPDQFLEIAKLRALRRIWARVLEASDVPEDGRWSPLYARTSHRMLAKLDPWNNMLRVTTAAFAAAAAGADGVTVTPFDAVGALPSKLGRRVARNTQLILQDESQLARVGDVAGGSWYVESLTDDLAKTAWAHIQRLEADGGMPGILTSGQVAKELAETAQVRSNEIAKRKRGITGVNVFPLLGDDGLERTEAPDTAKLEALEGERAKERPQLDQTIDSFAAAIAAATKGVGLDQLGQELTSHEPLPTSREPEPFELLRTAADGHDLSVRLVTVGPLARHTSVVIWAQSFFAAGGIAATADADSKLSVICAGRDEEDDAVAEAVKAERERGAEYIYLAQAKDAKDADLAIRDGVDMLEVLTAAQQRLGVEVES